MSLTITFEPAILAELEAEASARAISCEQIVCEAVEDYLHRANSSSPEYEAWFKVCYEEGKAAFERGEICSHEAVKQDMVKWREKYLKLLARD